MRALATESRHKEITVSIAGDPKTAKTFLSFTSPTPIFYHEFDIGSLNRVLPHLSKEVIAESFFEEYPLLSLEAALDVSVASKLLGQFRTEYRKSVIEAAKSGGTVIIDTESLWWELIQAVLVPADTGKKTGGLKYGPANADYRGAVSYSRDPAHRCNLVLIHQTKEIWEEGAPTGRREPHGHKENLSIVDFRLLTLKPYVGAGKTDFRIKIDNCGLNPKLEGIVIDPSGKTPGSIQSPATMGTVREILGLEG